MTEPEYDEVTCITAGELRAAGAVVPENIPDCGWVPRHALRYEVGKATGDPATGRFSVGIGVTFLQPFRWLEVTVDCTSGDNEA